MGSKASKTWARGSPEDRASSEVRSEAELLAACRNGDAEAFGELVRRYQDRVYNLAWRLTGAEEEAAEIAQEAFLKAWRGIASFRGESAFYTWVFRIVVNEARSRRRFQIARPAAVSLDAPVGKPSGNPDGGQAELIGQMHADTPDPAEEAGRRERKALVERALSRLPPEQRALIVLRDIEGCDYEEIARTLDCPKGTVKSRLHRARMALKELLAPVLATEDGSAARARDSRAGARNGHG